MRNYLPFLVVGLTTGSIYAIAAMGLVVTYTTSGVFNFAHGAVGMTAAYAFYSLRVDVGIPTWAAVLLAVLGVGPIVGLFIDRLLLRRLQGSSTASYLVVSLGLLVVLQGLAIVIYGARTRPVDPIFSTRTYEIPGVLVGIDQTIIVLIAAVAGLVLAMFFRRTRLGVYTRAVVDDPNLTQLNGLDAHRITTFSWMLGCTFAALSGVLLAPVLGLDAVLLVLLVIQAFGAAAVGRLRSLPLTYLGGILIGIGSALATKYAAGRPSLAGIPSSLPFVVLFGMLVFSRKGTFAEVARATGQRTRPSPRIDRRFPLPTLLGATAVAAILPLRANGSQILTATSVVIFVLIFASLGLLVGLSRQLSLCHAIFVVLGATTLAHLQHAGVPYLLGLVVAGLVLMPLGAILAFPAIRLSGLFLALATFGFGVLAQQLLFSTRFVFGTKGTVTLERPQLLGISMAGDRPFYFFVLAVVVVGLLLIELVRVTRLGRILQALADSDRATESLGVNPLASRVLVFCLAAFLAAVAGGLLGTLTVAVNTASFDFSQSLLWVTVLVTAGPVSLGGAIVAALLLVAVPSVFHARFVVEWLPIAFGLAAIFLAQAPNGLVGLVRLPDFEPMAAASRRRLGSRRMAERIAAVTR